MPEPGSSPPKAAVFLSYAREDTAAAQRIADALRGFAIEVWFDQSELRGGDAWDQKIRRQIKDCALFLPLISAATQARGEGYFRLEWKLAVERTHLMAEGMPFLVPVALGGLPEAGALVPPEFLRVQWTRLPGDAPTPAFVEQIHRLLGAPRGTPVSPPARSEAATGRPSTAPQRARWIWVAAALVALVAVAGIVKLLRHPAPPAEPAVAAAPPAAAVTDKSIAVLPFANMSEEKDSTFFTDGIHEDILTNLALIHDLRVVSRTSVEQYRNTTKPIAQIGQELHVAYILEGSVRRAGNKVRVTGQLIRAASDEHIWARAYDRDLTDIFGIQSELAQAIASALEARLSDREQDQLNRKPTENVAAYEAFLKARQSRDNDLSDGAVRDAIRHLREAVDLDPTFAEAWSELADNYSFELFNFGDGTEGYAEKAKAAIEEATRLAPEDPNVIRDRGTYYYYAFRDYARAAQEYRSLSQMRPNDPTLYNSLALIERRQGHWRESIEHSRRAVALDPSNVGCLRNLLSSLFSCGEDDEAIATERRMVALMPGNLTARFGLVQDIFQSTGKTQEGEAFFAGLSPQQASSPLGIELRKRWAFTLGRLEDFLRLQEQAPYFDGDGTAHYVQDWNAGLVYRALNRPRDVERVLQASLEQLRRNVEQSPQNSLYFGYLAGYYAALGRRAEAERCMAQSMATMPKAGDAVLEPSVAEVLAIQRSLLGDNDRAIAELDRLRSVPGGNVVIPLTPATLPVNPFFVALRADPRARALVDGSVHPKY